MQKQDGRGELCGKSVLVGVVCNQVYRPGLLRNPLLEPRVWILDLIFANFGGPFWLSGPSRPQKSIPDGLTDFGAPNESSGARMGSIFDHFWKKCEGFSNFPRFFGFLLFSGRPSGPPEAPRRGLGGAPASPRPCRGPNSTFSEVFVFLCEAQETLLSSPLEAPQICLGSR